MLHFGAEKMYFRVIHLDPQIMVQLTIGTFILCFFFENNPKELQPSSNESNSQKKKSWVQNWIPMTPKGIQMDTRRRQMEPKDAPEVPQWTPEGDEWSPNGRPKAAQGSPNTSEDKPKKPNET